MVQIAQLLKCAGSNPRICTNAVNSAVILSRIFQINSHHRSFEKCLHSSFFSTLNVLVQVQTHYPRLVVN